MLKGILMAAVGIIGGATVGEIASATHHASDAISRDPGASTPVPESLTPQVDTRMQKRSVEMVQHEILSRTGVRVKVRGTIDSDDAIASAQALAGGTDIFDNRSRFDESVVDDMVSSKLR
jgi:maltose-binding protein MalE